MYIYLMRLFQKEETMQTPRGLAVFRVPGNATQIHLRQVVYKVQQVDHSQIISQNA